MIQTTFLHQCKILIVEDNPAHCEAIRLSFRKSGAQVVINTVGSLYEYAHAVAENLPDIVLMDLNLPDGRALDVLSNPAENGPYPILVMTAHGNESLAVAAMKTGAFDYLVKSVEAIKLMPQTVTRALREWRLLVESRQVTMKLSHSEERYRRLYQNLRAMFERVPDPMVLLTSSLQIEWANQVALDSFGNSADGLVGRLFYSVLEPFHTAASLPVLGCFDSGEIDEFQWHCHDGRVWSIRALPFRETDENVSRALVHFHDVAHKIKTQSDAIRDSQLAVLGELAASVAHEINNPVNGVINYAQILANRFHDDGKTREIAERIIQEGGRIATIVKDLLSFSRPQQTQPEKLSLNDVLAESLSLAGAQLSNDGIILCIDLPKNLPLLYGVKSHLQQVLLNLISNARYALNAKFPRADDSKRIEITGEQFIAQDEHWVKLVFTDYGSGILEENLEKVLHPFFTTKPINEGTGLGLSISHGIIKSHGGRLTVASVYGQCTRFTIDLPCADKRKDGSCRERF